MQEIGKRHLCQTKRSCCSKQDDGKIVLALVRMVLTWLQVLSMKAETHLDADFPSKMHPNLEQNRAANLQPLSDCSTRIRFDLCGSSNSDTTCRVYTGDSTQTCLAPQLTCSCASEEKLLEQMSRIYRLPTPSHGCRRCEAIKYGKISWTWQDISVISPAKKHKCMILAKSRYAAKNIKWG